MTELVILFLTLSMLCGVAFVYPYLIYPMVLRVLPPVAPTKTGDGDCVGTPSVALLLCAYNEEASLPAKIENLRRMKAECPQLQILAYSDCSADATNQLLLDASDILSPIIGQKRAGKVRGMYELVQRTDADILVFTDANVMVDDGSLTRLIQYFSDSAIGAVAATLIYEDNEDFEASATSDVGGAYWRLEEHIKKLESRSGSMMGADGAFFARRRNGYPKIPADLVDDLAVSIGVVFDDLRCVSAPDVIGREHSVTNRMEEFKRKRRIACGAYSTYRYLRSQLRDMKGIDRFKFFSHKMMRWWGGAFLIAGAASLLLALVLAGYGVIGTFALLGLATALVALGHYEISVFGALYEVLLAVAATGLGVLESLRGRRYATWEPAKTR